MTVDFTNCCIDFLTLTAVSSICALGTGGVLSFLLIKWESRILEHFVKPILIGVLILLIGVWRIYRAPRMVEFATRDRISFLSPN